MEGTSFTLPEVRMIGRTVFLLEGYHDKGNLLEFIAFCARVSNPENQKRGENNERLVRYLLKNGHWSPFEMVHLVFEISTTREVSRQILRHRSFSFQEHSQRYASPLVKSRVQSTVNRQGSDVKLSVSHEVEQKWLFYQNAVRDLAENCYSWAVNNNIAKEVARKVLPEGLTVTKLYMAGTLRSFIHYVQLRTQRDTQPEHREVAKKIRAIIEKDLGFPFSILLEDSPK
ncbi:Thymidylate synthase ThyX [Galdieria sulphuraria]|uniref:Thymidylate synthase (FAD) n=1 Tax=Galdieria sulphuraria TaxID=130081 RepID=M2XQD5_GALSU|nr:thymidylate synthase (FAD) [Galdieria sulphuraria]EME25813.1 thymidylate synthase (FAD) [Galdieria sulphuraria]GJD09162.1 Thymidylate synthase ThyX [Galdieria sulphuraria]|eukprot:XP_005702333.1 thymidylate synthase (FAD) [Galdieria sulphuraria]